MMVPSFIPRTDWLEMVEGSYFILKIWLVKNDFKIKTKVTGVKAKQVSVFV